MGGVVCDTGGIWNAEGVRRAQTGKVTLTHAYIYISHTYIFLERLIVLFLFGFFFVNP